MYLQSFRMIFNSVVPSFATTLNFRIIVLTTLYKHISIGIPMHRFCVFLLHMYIAPIFNNACMVLRSSSLIHVYLFMAAQHCTAVDAEKRTISTFTISFPVNRKNTSIFRRIPNYVFFGFQPTTLEEKPLTMSYFCDYP